MAWCKVLPVSQLQYKCPFQWQPPELYIYLYIYMWQIRTLKYSTVLVTLTLIQAASEVQQTWKSKCKRISKSNVMNIIKSRRIWSETELLALANECADDGLDDLKMFIAEKLERVYWELIFKTWKLAEAPGLLARQQRSRMERISLLSLMNCHQKIWLKMAK